MPKQVTVQGREAHWVHLEEAGIATTTGFMLVDVSDVTNWPHGVVGDVVIHELHLSIRPDASFVGTIEVGFLSDVDTTDGEFHHVHQWDLSAASPDIHAVLLQGLAAMRCVAERVFGPITSGDTTFQTDVNLEGPDGAVSYPSGDGDLVLKVTRTAGTVDVAVTLGYSVE